MIKQLILFTFISLLGLKAQNIVEAKGNGLTRQDALQDALRNAVSQAVGVSLKAETRVENFMIISDAIASNTTGYIKKYDIIKEIPIPNKFEIVVRAEVTTNSLEADFKLLSRSIGGVRFLVMVDPQVTDDVQKTNLQTVVESINQYLATKNYRYVDQNRIKTLQKESANLFQSLNNSTNYAQQLAVLSNAQFIILVNQFSTERVLGRFDIPEGHRVSFQARAFDNCTGEGLGNILISGQDKTSLNTAIQMAVQENFSQLIGIFTGYIGSWVNNGTPFEIRFYNSGTFRDLRTLRNKLKEYEQ